MPDTDKILEAEQNIQNIASELEQMHDAATLLNDTQKQAAAVVESAQRLTKEMDELSTAIKKQNQDVQAGIEEARIAVRETKKRQLTMMGFMIIALIMLLAILLKI